MEADRVYKMVEDKFKLERTRIEEALKLRETRIQEKLSLDRIELQHRLQLLQSGILKETKRMFMEPNPTPGPKNMELRFSNKISQPILTCHEIKGECNTCIEVILFDSSTGKIIDVGTVASASVEIVVLGPGTDDWTGAEFNNKVVTVEERLPLLTVNVCKLQGGIGCLENVKFRHHSTQVKPTVFRLGARIVEKFEGIIVKEAKTESFVVKCYRNKYSKKNEIPNLSDKIWVLNNIRRHGMICRRLQDKGIDTVEKFLVQLLRNHQELKNIACSKGKKWEATVNHAIKCQSDKMYWYMNSQETSGVVFDIFGKLQGLCLEGEYAATNMLSENKKVYAGKLLSSAFRHWENVTPFDDLDSLQQHLVAIKTSFDLSNSRIPGQNLDTGPPFDQGIPVSDTSSLARCDSFGIHDVEHLHDSPLGLDQYSITGCGTMYSDSDVGCVVYGYGMQQQDFIDAWLLMQE